jgi:hypothetical protein
MNDQAFNQLTLTEKAALIQKKGTFIEAEDFYSFRILLYTIDQHRAEVTFDHSNTVINVEFVENENRISPHLDSSLEGLLDD